MSVEQTLAERGERYGDFTDHAEIAQSLQNVMREDAGGWFRCSSVQRQALTVIADKIARILSGDPNYADNWHDIQGYAKLVEDRLPNPQFSAAERVAELNAEIQALLAEDATGVRQDGETIIIDTPEQRAAVYAALGAAVDPEYGRVSIHFGAQPECPKCEYPTDAAGTHYATCSRLTAPEEYKAEAQVAFDEAAEISEALARQVSAGQIPDPAYSHCPHCGSPEGYLHNPDCNTMRRGKSRLGKTFAEYQANRATQEEPAAFDWDGAVREEEALIRAEEEPAAAMDDDSPRMQAIGQNGNDGEHYDDPWFGAPEWAKYKAQDMNGNWYWYSGEVYASGSQWVGRGADYRLDEADSGEPNPNWRDTLIQRP